MPDGDERWLLTSVFPLRSPGGTIIGAVSANVDITERKRMEAEVRASEARFRTVVDSLHEGLTVQGADGHISLWNPSAARMFGFDLQGTNANDGRGTRWRLLREDGTEYPVSEMPIANALRTGEPQTGTLVGVEFEGEEVRWLSINAAPLPRGDGEAATEAVSSFVDVTERRRMETELRASEALFRTVLESLGEGLVVHDREGRIVLWNASAERLLGVAGSELAQNPAFDPRIGAIREDGSPIANEDRPTSRALAMATVQEPLTMGIRRLDGERRWLTVHAAPVRDDDGSTVAAVASFSDITERKRMEEELRANEAQFRTVIESLHEGLVVQDAAGQVSLWNRSAERILGISGEEMDLRSLRDPRSKAIREDGSDFPIEERPVALAILSGRPQEATIGNRRPDGSVRWHSVIAAPLPEDGGGPLTAVASFLDVTERVEQTRRAEEHLRQIEAYSQELEAANGRLEALATTDGLTGLKNHRFFQDTLRRKVEQCGPAGFSLSVALLDVDRFKSYNDDFGHQAGDEVLRGVARTLEGAVRRTDLVARYGGEEFVIVMPGLDEDGALAMVERVREAVAATSFDLRSVTASFGVATLGPIQPDAASLIKAADEALYRSKAAGRNRTTHWNSGALALA